MTQQTADGHCAFQRPFTRARARKIFIFIGTIYHFEQIIT